MANNNQNPSRRSVLKGIGASAGAAAGSVSFTSTVAAKNNTSKRFLKKAVQSEKTQSVCDELGTAHLKRAGSVVLEHTDDDTGKVVIRQAIFFLPAGALIYSETGKNYSDALFKFGVDRGILSKFTQGSTDTNEDIGVGWNLSGETTTRGSAPVSQLKEKYQSLPDGTSPMILGTESEGIFRRNATDRERELVAAAVPIDITDEVDVITGSDVRGFTVTKYKEQKDESATRDITDVVTESQEFSPTTLMGTVLSAEDLHVSIDTGLSTQSHTIPECAGVCTGCASSITGCALCAPACANPVGPVTCPICLFPVCHGILVASCAFCAKCVDEHYF